MNLNKLYKLQAELDKHILEKHNIKMSKEELLDNTILALLVEVGELANTTRCFKHWSTKGMMEKEVVIEELADVWHFYLSIGNQIGHKYSKDNGLLAEVTEYKKKVNKENINKELTELLRDVYIGIAIEIKPNYECVGYLINALNILFDFTDEEVEQAYLKKHEENYKRQREGY